jgi:LAO/AO transport system kinase
VARRHSEDVGVLIEHARAGDPRSVGRLITLVENGSPLLRDVAERLMPHTGDAQVVGITGAPGVGKSTSTSVLIAQLRAAGKRVGVLAVDPSSPFSGGALLGDRVRMQEHAIDPGVFIRSMATRGHLGGLAAAAPQALRVLDAAGFDVILIETVGVGQSEIDIISLADSTLVLMSPGMGDGIQAAKAGILEIADIFVVNKADQPGADQVARDLRALQSMGSTAPNAGGWRVPVIRTVAATGQGIAEVIAALDDHRHWMAGSQELQRRRRARAAAEIEAIGIETLRHRFSRLPAEHAVDALAGRVVAGTLDPYSAADELVASL